jgi:hypothetical protein
MALSTVPALSNAATEPGLAAAPKGSPVDYGSLIRDLTLTSVADGGIKMAMWMPEEFWRAAIQSGGRMTDQGTAEFVSVMHPYILVAVLDGRSGITGYHFTDTSALADEVTIEDAHGTTYAPLPPDSVAEDLRNLIQMMRPLLSNMMGSMGQHLDILVFPSLDKAGQLIADPKKDGALSVHLGDTVLRYRLPLGSLLPPSVDLKTGESFPGNYRFNPFTGSKLVPRPADTHPAQASKTP